MHHNHQHSLLRHCISSSNNNNSHAYLFPNRIKVSILPLLILLLFNNSKSQQHCQCKDHSNHPQQQYNITRRLGVNQTLDRICRESLIAAFFIFLCNFNKKLNNYWNLASCSPRTIS